MSCHTPPCWSMNAELSGERRKEVNVSMVMMRVGMGERLCLGDSERDEDDGVWGVVGGFEAGERAPIFVLETNVGEEGI
jgi:hypothetical protein